MENRDVIDAEFVVVQPRKERRFHIDWRVWLIIAGVAAMALKTSLGV